MVFEIGMVPTTYRDHFYLGFHDLEPLKISFSLRPRAKIHIFLFFTHIIEKEIKSLPNPLVLTTKMRLK